MIVRQLKAQEMKRAQELCAVCFEYSWNNEKSPQEIVEALVQSPQSRMDAAFPCHWGPLRRMTKP